MAGQFSPTARPIRPGGYFNFDAVTPQPRPVNALGTAAISMTHNWGPANQVVECGDFAEFVKFFGDGGASQSPPVYTPGYKAVYMAFRGEGLPARGGAGTVLAYRMAGAGALASSVTLQNTSSASAITLTAVYSGTYGNNIGIAVVANARNPSTQLDLQVYVEGFLTETWTFNKTDITGLANAINATVGGSAWVDASNVTSGTALSVVSAPQALTGGNDGATLTGTDFTNMQAAFQVQRFSVYADQNIAATASWTDGTGSASLTALLAWQAGLNLNGKRFMTVIGGSSADSATTAAARSLVADDPNVINIGIGTYTDSVFGTLTTSQLAPRLAGIIAARTEKQGLSFARLAGLNIVGGASDSDIVTGIQSGYMTISRDSNALAPIRFEKGITTFTTPSPARPLWAYTNPKFVLTMQHLENELTEYCESNVVGILPVDDNSVAEVLGQLITRMKRREADQIIQPGWTVVRNPDPAPTPADDFIAVLYGVSFMRDVEQVLNTVVVQ